MPTVSTPLPSGPRSSTRNPHAAVALLVSLCALLAGRVAAETVSVVWSQARHATVSGSNLSKSGGGGGWNAGAAGTQALIAGDGDFEFSAVASDKRVSAGLSEADLSLDPFDPLYSIQLLENGTLTVVESGLSRGAFGPYAAGDRFRIHVSGSVVTYLKNDSVFYTSSLAARYPLQPDVSFFSPEAGIESAVLSGQLGTVVSWTNLVGAAASSNVLTKTAAGGWNAGGVSTQALTSAGGTLDFTIKESLTGIVGLSNGDPGQTAPEVRFGIRVGPSGASVWESGASRVTVPFAANDRFQIAVTANIVRYYRNGVLIYTSSLTPSYPLLVDAAFNTAAGRVWGVTLSGSLEAVAADSPSISIPSGNYAAEQVVVLSTSTPGAAIHYTTNGAEPTTSDASVPSGGTVVVSSSRVLKAKAWAPGLFPSASAMASYAIGGVVGAEPVRWTGAVNVAVLGSLLRKTSSVQYSWDAGAYSIQQIAAGDGYVEFLGSGAGSALGLGNGNGDASAADIEYGIQAEAGSVYLWEHGRQRGPLGSYSANDRLRVAVENGVVKFLKNGVVFALSAIPPRYPMNADASLSQIGGAIVDPLISSGGRAAAPTFSLGTGNYATTQLVVVTGHTPGATIRYTTDGTDPSPSDAPVASGDAVTVDHSLTLKAKVFADGLVPSATTTASYSIGVQSAEAVRWTNLVNAAARGGSLRKAGGGTGWDAGGISVQQITEGDGYVELTGAAAGMAFGLGNGDVSQAPGDLEYGVVLNGGNVTVYEYGTSRGNFETYVATDVFRIGIEGGVVRFRKNGTVFYTSPAPPQYPLNADASLKSVAPIVYAVISAGGRAETPIFSVPGGSYATAQAVVLSVATPGTAIHYTTSGAEPTQADLSVASGGSVLVEQSATLKARAFVVGRAPSAIAAASYAIGVQSAEPVVWTNVVNASANGNTLTKTSTVAGWNAGGASVQAIAQGDGYVEFTASAGTLLCGLGNGDDGVGYGDIEYAFSLSAGALSIFEFGIQKATLGGGVSGEILRVGVESGVVRYRRNGAVVYTSTLPPEYPLNADSAIHAKGSTVSNARISSGGRVATPSFSVAAGSYSTAQAVVVTAATPAALIYYTTDGTEPTPASAVVASGSSLPVDRSLTLKAKAFLGGATSATASASYAIGVQSVERVFWTAVVNAAVNGNVLTKTNASSSWDAGGVSAQSIANGDGYVEFTVGTTNTMAVGLGNGDVDASPEDVEFALRFGATATYTVYEYGVAMTPAAPMTMGDTFRIGIESGALTYRRNGVVVYTSAAIAQYPLNADCSFKTTGSSILNALISTGGRAATPVFGLPSGTYASAQAVVVTDATPGATIHFTTDGTEPTADDEVIPAGGTVLVESSLTLKAKAWASGVEPSATASASYAIGASVVEPVLWTNAVNASPNGANLTKTGTTNTFDAGAVSEQLIEQGDGYVEFKAVVANVVAGLGNGDAGQGNADVEYGVQMSAAAAASVSESGVTRASLGSFTASDVFRVAIENGAVRYRKNGALLYTSTIVPRHPLNADASIRSVGATLSNAKISGLLRVAAPVLSPGGGTYDTPQAITMTSATTGAAIHYTTDESEPDPATSPLYTEPVTISTRTVVKAKAFKPGVQPSKTIEAEYQMAFGALTPPIIEPGWSGIFPYGTVVSMMHDVPGAAIRYTTDGTVPGPDATVYTGPFPLTEEVKIWARAYHDDYDPSPIEERELRAQAAMPTFIPGPVVTYQGSIDVTASTSTPGATIHYTTNGTNPTEYDMEIAPGQVLHLTSSVVIRAATFKQGLIASPLTQVVFTRQAAPATITPSGGVAPLSVTITTTETAETTEIRYTTDGSEPTRRSSLYTGEIEIDRAVTLKTKVFARPFLASGTATAEYTLDSSVVSAPVFDPPGGRYTTRQEVTIASATSAAAIRYTTNGQDPTESDPLVPPSGIVLVDRSCLLKARAWHTDRRASTVTRGFYALTGSVAAAALYQSGYPRAGFLAVKTDRTVWFWKAPVDPGSVVGLPDDFDYAGGPPMPMPGLTDVVALATTFQLNLALKGDGTVWAWGVRYGDTPVPVAGLVGIVAIAVGGKGALALDAAGTVFVWRPAEGNFWGWDPSGGVSAAAPVIGFSGPAIAIAASGDNFLALTDDGTAWQWGSSNYAAPVDGRAYGLQDVTAIAAGPGTGWYFVATGPDGAPVHQSWDPGTVAADASLPYLVGRSGSVIALDGTLSIPGLSGTHILTDTLGADRYMDWMAHTADGRVWIWPSFTYVPAPVPNFSLTPDAALADDPDADGVSSVRELAQETDPYDSDTNDDGITDQMAIALGVGATSPDVDRDGLSNRAEAQAGTNPLAPDTDGDGALDGADCFPLDLTRSQCLSPVPGDTTPPTITLRLPQGAQLISTLP